MEPVYRFHACVRKVRSTRRYKFIRDSDQVILARGETDWVFVDAATGRPRSIPEKINDAFGVCNDEPEN
jgi:acyl-CoA thioester hydrolase